jgi:hypothetical protein
MITLDDLRAAAVGPKHWRARMWIDGQPYTIADTLPTRTLSALRQRSTCSVELRDLPPTGEKPAYIDLILNDTKVERFFTGKTDQRGAQAETVSRTANLIDILNLDRTLGTTLTWSGRSFVDAVMDVLSAAGLGSADIDSIFDPGSGYALGPVYAIKVKKSENIGQVLKTLMDFGGTACYVTPAGRVRVVENTGVPASTSAISYAEARDLAAGEFGIEDAGFSLEGNERAVSAFTATGPKRPDGAIPDGTYTASGVTGRSESVSYPYLQSDAQAQVIAERELGRRARDLANVWFAAPLNPLLQPRDTILFRCARIGYPANTPATITEVASAADAGMRVQLSVGPSLVDGYASSIAPPVADFSMQIEQQLVTLAGVPVTRAFVQCQDQSRDKAGYAITARAWTASGPDASPASASTTAPMFFFSSLTGAAISLTVTSASGEAASVTKAPQALNSQVLTRVVSVAAGAGGWQVLATTAGWRTFAPGPSCSAVPPINEAGPLWAGFADGAIYKSADALASPPPLAVTLDAAITCMWVNEADQNHILAGHDSSLSGSTNGGATWALLHTFADMVLDCQSSPSSPGEIRVCVGETEQISYDGGASWATLVTVVSGGSAAMIASAPWGHAVAVDGVPSEVNALLFEEGYAVDWTAIANPADRPSSGLVSVTPLLSTQGYLAGECADLVRDGSLESLVLSAGAGRLWQLLWNGAWFVASLLPAEAQSGPGKVINALAAYPIGTAAAVQIGYGALGAPLPKPGNLIIPTWGVSGANDGIWIHDASGWRKAAAPVAGAYWQDIATNPFNRSEWLLIGNSASSNQLPYSSGGPLRMADGVHSAVWHTTDAGATWAPLTLTIPTVSAGVYYIKLNHVLWPSVGGWAVGAEWWRNTGNPFPIVWRSTGGSTKQTNEYIAGPRYVAGQDGEIVIVASYMSVVSAAGVWGARVTWTPANGLHGAASVVPGSRALWAASTTTGALYRTADYRTTAPTITATPQYLTGVVAMPDGSAYAYTADTANAYISHVQPNGSATLAHTAPARYLSYLESNASRSAIAGIAAFYGFVYWDGTTWGKIDFPWTGAIAGNFGRLAVTDEAA